MKTIYIEGQPLKLDAAALIQSGGEGMVFELDAKSAVKLYHRPHPAQAARLRALMGRFTGCLPAGVLLPDALVQDAQGRVIGFRMARLPAGARPLKLLSTPQGSRYFKLQTAGVLTLFLSLHESLSRLHQQSLVVGDLSDHNLHLAPTASGLPQAYWLDVDSYQFGSYPCPVALQSCLDPHLYSVTDLSARPVFSPQSDWYAYFVLLVKALLHVHPYGGVHHQYKSLETRATAGISILHPAVIYPKMARPIETLSDELLHYLHRVFEQGHREPFPRWLLENHAAALLCCSHCGLFYSAQRAGCPGCCRPAPVTQPAIAAGPQRIRRLVQVDGEIEFVGVQAAGRLLLVARSGSSYMLIRAGTGGEFERLPLFNGRGDYRFDLFADYLVVNPAGTQQLLILDTRGPTPQRVTMVNSETFRGEVVFATTPAALYRLANGYVMRGTVRDGLFVEDLVATAHRRQTQLWGNRQTDRIAGWHRIFDRHHFFLLDGKGCTQDITAPQPAPEESVQDLVALSAAENSLFLLHVARRGRLYNRTLLVDRKGCVLHVGEQPAGTTPHTLAGKALWGRALLHPTDDGIVQETAGQQQLMQDTAGVVAAGHLLQAHPAGILVQQPGNLYLLSI